MGKENKIKIVWIMKKKLT